MADRVPDAAAWDILTSPLTVTVAELARRWNISTQTVRIYKRLESEKARQMAALIDDHRQRAEAAATTEDEIAAALAIRCHLLPPARTAEHTGKLTDDQVREIRTSKASSAKLAKKMGVSSSSVRMVRTGKTYTHVTD